MTNHNKSKKETNCGKSIKHTTFNVSRNILRSLVMILINISSDTTTDAHLVPKSLCLIATIKNQDVHILCYMLPTPKSHQITGHLSD